MLERPTRFIRIPETIQAPIQPGIEVITGGMFSGKTEHVISMIRAFPYRGVRVVAFKPALDTRRGRSTINSENGTKYPARSIKSSLEILGHARGFHAVVIDEAQFFDMGLVGVVSKLVGQGKRVIIAGLNTDFRGEPFGPMRDLILAADHITVLHAVCKVCRREASFSQRLVDGHPANYTDPVQMVGAQELYEARCREHHEVPGKPIAEEKLRLRRVDNRRYSRAYSRMERRIREILKHLTEKNNFEVFLGEAKKEWDRVIEENILGNYVAIRITDRLGDKNNALIVTKLGALGISPERNAKGIRLEASSCLIQMFQQV